MSYAIVSGLAISGTYILLALGFTLLLRVADIINLAHGAVVVGGMYLTIVLVNNFEWQYPLSIPAAIAIGFIPLWLIYELFLRRARKEGHRPQIIYTIIILSIAEVVYEMVFGSDLVSLDVPPEAVDILGVTLRTQTLLGFGVAVVVCIAFFVIFKFTSLGKAIEVAGKYPDGAKVIGLPTERLYRIVWFVGVGMALLAGALIVASSPASPFLGLDFLIIPVVISLVARLSFIGTIFAAVLYGVGYQVLAFVLTSPTHATVAIYALFLIVLALTPAVGNWVNHLRMKASRKRSLNVRAETSAEEQRVSA
jgi:branched-chain amino acid transport system permease protein